MKKIVTLVIATLALSTCGIEEYYYLPQATLNRSVLASEADVYLPSLSSYYYAEGYIIFYRIYLSIYPYEGLSSSDLSGTSTSSSTARARINSALNSNYNTLHPYTDQANHSSQISETTFSSLNYSELFFHDGNVYPNIINKLTNSGGTLNIQFNNTVAGGRSEFSINGETYQLARAIRSGTIVLPSDRYFFWTNDLTQVDNNTNVDVSNASGAQTAYISLYVIAVGSANMKREYGKPTHIGIFLLPNRS